MNIQPELSIKNIESGEFELTTMIQSRFTAIELRYGTSEEFNLVIDTNRSGHCIVSIAFSLDCSRGLRCHTQY